MVHPDQVASNADQVDSSPTFISDVPLLATNAPILASELLALNTIAPTPVRRSNRPYNPPLYLHNYHYNLVSTHVLASASLTQSHESTAILYPLSFTLSYSKLYTPHRIFFVALSVAKEPNSYA